ncbi:MAG: hypothetical protein KF774_20060 [Planctomyces sp.]|nr:hypothetical protein [Planctomyces sp.]
MDAETIAEPVAERPRPGLRRTLRDARRLLRQIAASSPGSDGRAPDVAGSLQQLERDLAAEAAAARSNPKSLSPADKELLKRTRAAFVGIHLQLHEQLRDLNALVAESNGAVPDPGVYQAGAGRRATTGAWLNVRSSP